MFPELSVTLNVAVRTPEALGVNVTEMEQVALEARLARQVLVKSKSAPMIATLLIASAADPVFESVTDCGPLVVPTVWELKDKGELGDRLAEGEDRAVAFSIATTRPPSPMYSSNSLGVSAFPRGAANTPSHSPTQVAVTRVKATAVR